MLRVVGGDGTVWEREDAIEDLETLVLDELEALDEPSPDGPELVGGACLWVVNGISTR